MQNVNDIVFITLCIASPLSTYSQEIPPSHVKVLDEILSKHINLSSIYPNSMMDILFGFGAKNSDATPNLGINVLDHKALKTIIEKTKEHYNNISNPDYRKRNAEYLVYTLGHPFKRITDKAFTLMKQHIYSSRFRLNDTNRFRAMYRDDISYNVAIMISMVHNIIIKSENYYSLLQNFSDRRVHFLYVLILYEKILAASMDVVYLVRRAFDYHANWSFPSIESMFDSGPGAGAKVVIPPSRPPHRVASTTGAPGNLDKRGWGVEG